LLLGDEIMEGEFGVIFLLEEQNENGKWQMIVKNENVYVVALSHYFYCERFTMIRPDDVWR